MRVRKEPEEQWGPGCPLRDEEEDDEDEVWSDDEELRFASEEDQEGASGLGWIGSCVCGSFISSFLWCVCVWGGGGAPGRLGSTTYCRGAAAVDVGRAAHAVHARVQPAGRRSMQIVLQVWQPQGPMLPGGLCAPAPRPAPPNPHPHPTWGACRLSALEECLCPAPRPRPEEGQ